MDIYIVILYFPPSFLSFAIHDSNEDTFVYFYASITQYYVTREVKVTLMPTQKPSKFLSKIGQRMYYVPKR